MSSTVAANEWGHVDSDGTVFVHTEAGDRAVGSWQAGDPEAGLAYYGRRYQDLAAEIELLEQRLQSGLGNPRKVIAQASTLRESLATAAVVGDLVVLDRRLDKIGSAAHTRLTEMTAGRETAKRAATAAKESLIAEAEKLADSEEWKAAGERLAAIAEEWKKISGLDRHTDQLLWRRFAAARNSFTKKRKAHFAELSKQRAAIQERKETLVTQAEALSESDDWGATARRLKQLMVEWKSLGRTRPNVEHQLWNRFRTAQDKFFTRRSQEFTKRDEEYKRNLQAKEELIAEAENISIDNIKAAQARLRDIQQRWEALGHVPQEARRQLEKRLHSAERRVRDAVEQSRRRSDPTTHARVEQVRDQVSKYESQAAKAKAAGDARRAAEAEQNAAMWRQWLADAERAIKD